MNKLILIPLIALFALSCSKEENTNPATVSSYHPMSVGNYWVYGFFDIDTLGIEQSSGFKDDSINITHTEIINKNEYFVFEGIGYPYSTGERKVLKKLRDSSGYLVDPHGRVFFAEKDFQDSITVHASLGGNNDTVYTIVYQMSTPNSKITVPAGTYDVLNFGGTVNLFPSFLQSSHIPNPRSTNNYYTRGVGEILDTYFYASQKGYSEKRLLRYQVN